MNWRGVTAAATVLTLGISFISNNARAVSLDPSCWWHISHWHCGNEIVWLPGPDELISAPVQTTTTSTSTTSTTTTEPAPASTTTSEPAPFSTTTTTVEPEPPTTTVPPETSTTTTTQPPTTTAAVTTTTTYQAPKTTTSSSSTTTLATASSTTDLASTTTTPETTLPVFDSIPPTVNQTSVGQAHGVKPRHGYGKGTTPATPIVQTVTVLLTSPISPISLARKKKK